MKLEIITKNGKAHVEFRQGMKYIKDIVVEDSSKPSELYEVLSEALYTENCRLRVEDEEHIPKIYPSKRFFSEITKVSENTTETSDFYSYVCIFLQEWLVFNKIVEPDIFQMRRFFRGYDIEEDSNLLPDTTPYEILVNGEQFLTDDLYSSIINGSSLRITAFLEPEQYQNLEKILRANKTLEISTDELAFTPEITGEYIVLEYFEYQLETGYCVMTLGRK